MKKNHFIRKKLQGFVCLLPLMTIIVPAFSQEIPDKNAFLTANQLYQEGQYFRAARYAFSYVNTVSSEDFQNQARGNSLIALALNKSGLYQSASYFFIRTLQLQDEASTRSVLQIAPELSIRLGSDLIRKALMDYTRLEQYSQKSRDVYLYILAKEALLRGQPQETIRAVNQMSSNTQFGSFQLYPYALQLRASANAILNHVSNSLSDFRACEIAAIELGEAISDLGGNQFEVAKLQLERKEAIELASRCQAGLARAYYQAGQFLEAEKAWDRISKNAFVWPEILFEQAWNAFALKTQNRVLGKLVSYKSPSLQFLFNSEVDVLRAISYMSLCLYNDTNEVINEFNKKYTSLGERIKGLVEKNSDNMKSFYLFGKTALKDSLYTSNELHRVANRFVRSPYFENIIFSEKSLESEKQAIARFASIHANQSRERELRNTQEGFPGFLNQVLKWRMNTIEHIGGAFVKNSLMDYHSVLLSDFDKMSFIKLEMLGKAKMTLQGIDPYQKKKDSDRIRGNETPHRRDDQFYWSFNGEFWNDELGDYIFGLESKCGEKN